MIGTKQYYTFNDVMLSPLYSDIESRSEVSLEQVFLGSKLSVPILSAAMDTVTGPEMAITLRSLGGLGVLHRFFNTLEGRKSAIKEVSRNTDRFAFSIGIKDPEGLDILYNNDLGMLTPIVNIDVAHGDHIGVVRTIKHIKKNAPSTKVLAGNVATRDGYYRLADAGADGIKVGIGGSSVCTTRIVTGHGVPTLSAIMDCAEAKFRYPETKLIADGGIENSGQIVKAIAAGADAVMLGTLLSGTDEAPGIKVEINGESYKQFRGQSTVGSNQSTYAPEGVGGFVPAKGSVENVIKALVGGIRSGLSYSGARNLEEFRENAEFILVSKASVEESHHRIVLLSELQPV